MPNDLGPEHRLTLRQADQAREDFAQILDELDFVKELLARLPTRRDQAFVSPKIMFGSAVIDDIIPPSLVTRQWAPHQIRYFGH
jgi:hypothetical protein